MAANSYTTTQGSVSSNTITFPIIGHQGYIYLLLDYDKGNGTSIAVSPVEFYDPNTGDWVVWPAAYASATTMGAWTITLDATKKYVIPFEFVSKSFTKMRVTNAFTGGDTAILGVNILID